MNKNFLNSLSTYALEIDFLSFY